MVSGTAFAQVLTLLALPLLTRLYSPADFNLLAVYASILGIVTVAACLRLEIAIPLPQRESDAANLLVLALCSSAGVSGLLMLAVVLLPIQIATVIGQPKLHPYLWLLPLGIWFSSSYTALQFWMTRKKRFSIIAKTRVAQAFGGIGTQVGLGWAAIAPLGLLLGQMFTIVAGILGLARDLFKNDRATLCIVNLRDMQRVLSEYKRFPRYSICESLANSASSNLPIIIIAALAAGPEAGFLTLASKIMAAPVTLIGTAVSQVYLSHAPDEARVGTLGKFTTNIMGGLIKTGAGPLIFAGIVAPSAFPIIFGAQWQRAGDLVAWMTPWFVIQFLTSPISMALHVTKNQYAALLLQLFGFVLRVGSVVIAAYWAERWIVECYAVSGLVFYLIYLCVVVSATKIKLSDVLRTIASGAMIIASWTFAAIFTCIVLLRAM